MVVEQINHILDCDVALRHLTEQSLQQAAAANPHLRTNPVRTLDDWYAYLEYFLHHMPWDNLDLGEDATFFQRIDQNIGYFYYLLDQPLEALQDRGYWYHSLQYEPRVAAWLVEYNKAWGEWLSGADSWNDSYYYLARTDTRFNLDTDRYESPSNWHSWNDFFARRLKFPFLIPGERLFQSSGFPFISPCDGVIMDYPVKTMNSNHLQDLLGDSPYAERFAAGKVIHLVLDVFDYHRFHAPCKGKIVELKIIPGIHAGGGVIIWDEEQGCYRYDQLGAVGFQSLETRGVLVMDTPDYGYVALVAVGIQQVSSVVWHEQLKVGTMIQPGDELGRFLFGGSDVVLLFESGKAPAFEMDKAVKVGEII